MKKIISRALAVALALITLVSCGNSVKFEDVEYRENGLSVTLPNTMRRQDNEDYTFYFSGMSMDVIFSAMKITDEFLESVELESGVSAGEYVDTIIARRGLEKSKLYYKYYEEKNQYNFRYNYVSESGYEMFFFVTVMGNSDNLWYIEMCCDADESSAYLDTFEIWRRNLKTY